MKSYILFFFVLTNLLLTPVANYCQTISPIYIENDSIYVDKIQFINPKTGLSLRTEFKGKLIHINEIFSDTIKMIIPFKNGEKIYLDTVETKYFNDCVLNASYNKNANSSCGFIVYSFGHVIRLRNTGKNCQTEFNNIQINSSNSYYKQLTKKLDMNESKRRKLFFKLHKKNSPKK